MRWTSRDQAASTRSTTARSTSGARRTWNVSTERPDGHRLRSNYEYGSFHWAVRRAQWRALGIADDDLDKPKIAVVNSSSELASCFSHLDELAEIVKDAIRAAGG